jgi:hypothetical protein
MARTPDLAGALEAVVARTLKGTLGPRLRRLEGQLRRLDRKLKKLRAARRKPGRKPGRRRGRARGRMTRSPRRRRR